MKPRILGAPLENSHARYWPLSSGREGGAPVTVREGKGGVLICLTDLHDRDCAHIRVIRDEIAAGTRAAPVAAEAAA